MRERLTYAQRSTNLRLHQPILPVGTAVEPVPFRARVQFTI